MTLIIILCTLACLQVWGSKNPLHLDRWFFKWHDLLKQMLTPKAEGLVVEVLFIGIPVGAVALASFWLPTYFAYALALFVLLYSLGRGPFAPYLDEYTRACSDTAWDEALDTARRNGIITEVFAQADWPKLNQSVLEKAAYQGFERLFAVLFWFVFFGPAGALMYRLSYLGCHHLGGYRLSKWLWAVEWPAVRLLSASFAITGNFVGCINRWKAYLTCAASSSALVLRETILGALSIDDELVQSCDCTQREIKALKRLYTRTLWFWVAVVAIVTILY